MSAADDYRAALLAHAPLAALVGTGVAENAVDKGTTVPYVVFTGQVERFGGLDGGQHCAKHTFRTQCWAASSAEASAVADAVTAAVEAAGETVLGRESGYDADLALDAEVLIVEWWEGG